MALLAHKQAPFAAIPTSAYSHTLFQEILLPKHCEPQTTPQESSESDPAQGRWPLLQSIPCLPYLMISSSSVLICVHLWFQVLRQERQANHAMVPSIPTHPRKRKNAPICVSCSSTPAREKRYNQSCSASS